MKDKQQINVNSEIGKLNLVLLHRPSAELESLTPSTMGKLLFDDVPYLQQAQYEHDCFNRILTENSIKVLLLENCLNEILTASDEVRKKFISDFIAVNNIFSDEVKESIKNYCCSLEVKALIKKVFAGIRKNELEIQLIKFPDLIHHEDTLFWVNPLPNLYFTRDPAAVIGNGINISSMRKKARQAEVLFMKYIHKYHPLFQSIPLWYDNISHYPIEGGDQLVLSKNVVAIGYSERTSAKAIEEVSKSLLKSQQNQFTKVLVFAIPKTRAFMHLDTVFTMIDYDKFTVHPSATETTLSVYELTLKSNGELAINYTNERLDIILASALRLPAVELLKCGGGDQLISEREQWNGASNTLAIKPGTVIVYDRNYVTNELLVKNRINVIEIPSAELSRGRGGPRCMSMPLNRDNI